MKLKFFFILLGVVLLISNSQNSIFAQNKLPYPIIFVHGLADYENAFAGAMEYLRDHDNMGDINVFDIVLNADDDSESAIMSEDVKWEDFTFNGDEINIGRRNYSDNIDEYIHEWTDSNLFAINFQEESIDGAAGFFNDYFDQSNEAAIFKQGYALNKMIQEVLDYTGAEKVILVGHSMGGMCIREYLQRTDENNMHVNWIDPTTEDGHKVARVVTFGTPHLGSNTSLDPTKTEIPNALGNTEANRDLLYEYNNYTFCDGFPQGIYLFGGNENCIASEGGLFGNSTFDNVDINCNGSQIDDIIGINESPESFSYNPNMPLPTNIKYTYITSIWIGWDVGLIGDGAVSIEKQWLHDAENNPVPLGITDTLLTDVFHTSEGNDYLSVIRGLDEPNLFPYAYELNLNREVLGYVTFQQNRNSLDEDIFKLKCEENNTIAFVLDGELSAINSIEFYDLDENLILSKEIINAIDTTFVNVPPSDNEIYVKLIGNATSTSWENPYRIKFFPVDLTFAITRSSDSNISLFPNPSKGMLYFENSKSFSLDKLQVLNSNAQIVFELQNLTSNKVDLSFLENGFYFIRFYSNSKVEIKQFVIVK